MKNANGKGDSYRKVDQKQYDKNYAKAFKKKKDRAFPEIKNRNVTELNRDIKPYDIFDTTPSLTYNNVLYWEFKAG